MMHRQPEFKQLVYLFLTVAVIGLVWVGVVLQFYQP